MLLLARLALADEAPPDGGTADAAPAVRVERVPSADAKPTLATPPLTPPAPLYAPVAPSPPATAAATLGDVDLGGWLVDDKARLLRFFGLVPGLRFDDEARTRLDEDLARLDYRATLVRVEPLPPGDRALADGTHRLVLRIEPVRVIRSIRIKGNWPYHFDDEIRSHLRLRPGMQLPASSGLPQFLADEEARVTRFLEGDGFFGSNVSIGVANASRGDWVNLTVTVTRGEHYPISGVELDGAAVLSQNELFNIFDHGLWFWRRLRPSNLREDARRAEELLRDRGYPAGRVNPDFELERDLDKRAQRIRLRLKITSRRHVDIAFFGNQSMTDKELRAELTIFSAGAYDEIELAESARALQRAYQQRGFFEARVAFQRRRLSETRDQVSFQITEGPELRVRGVDFASDDGRPLSFDAADLREKAELETKVYPRFGLGSGGYLTTLQLQQDIDRLVELYHQRGFPVAKVRAEVARDPSAFGALGALGAEAAGSNQRNELYVRFYVVEGRRERVEDIDISFVGEHKKSLADIARALKLHAGDPYSPAASVAEKSNIVRLYRATPYAYVESVVREEWNADHTRVRLYVSVDEGPPVTFGEILIRGNFRTRLRTVLIDLPWRAGDPFSYDKLDEAERNLQTHRIFTVVRVTPLLEVSGDRAGVSDPTTGKPVDRRTFRNPVPVVVRVEERSLEVLRFQASFAIATDRLPYYTNLFAGLLMPNFAGFGSALELRGNTGFSADAWDVSLRYSDPRVFGARWAFDSLFFYRREVTVRFGNITSFGASVGLNYLISATLRAYLRYDNYLIQLPATVLRTAGTGDIVSVSADQHTSKFTLGMVWDRRVDDLGRPDPLNPRRGWLLQGGVAYAFPPSTDNSFVNFFSSDNATHFVALSAQLIGILPFRLGGGRFSLMGNLRLDHGFPIGQPAMPLAERYFAGGDTSTRGYDPDSLKSEIITTSTSPIGDGAAFRVVPQGGNLRLLSTIEVQFPIARSFLGLGEWVGAVFYDVGAIANGFPVLTGNDFRHSIGISLLRVLTAVGPLSLEYAYPLTQTLAEERWKTNPWYSHFPGRIHFNWGIPLTRL